MFRRALIAGLVTLAIAAPGSALAQMYKGKTVTMIINYPAGGPTDIEGRIIAHHLAAHIPGRPNVIVKNMGGAGGMIGSNFLGEIAKPDGETFGFFTWNPIAELLGDPGMRVRFSAFELLGGVQNPVVVYARKDTAPGLNTAADLMKVKEINTLSLDTLNTYTVHQALALDVLGVKFKAVTGYKGLKEVETAILQNEGQLANSSLPGWRASIEPTMMKQGIVIPLWQVAPPVKGAYPRSPAVPEIQTFEEYFAAVNPGKKPSRHQLPGHARARSTRRPRCSAPSSCRPKQTRRPSPPCARRSSRCGRTRPSSRITPRRCAPTLCWCRAPTARPS